MGVNNERPILQIDRNDNFDYTSIVYPFCEKSAIDIHPNRAWEEYSEHIKSCGIEQARIRMPNLDGLPLCSGLKYLYILPPTEFDYKPLYDLPEVKFLNCGNTALDTGKQSEVDYSYINGLEMLLTDVNRKTVNYNKLDKLTALGVWSFKGKSGDLEDLFSSEVLEQLSMISCRNSSLYGIGRAKQMRCLYISRNRKLEDISALREVGDTLTALRIEACPNIHDFTALYELHNLELLELSGTNSIDSLDFIENMPKLKTLILSMNVKDGDLSRCADLSYVYVQNRRHYNLKDEDIPKGKYFHGNESIESWKRFE